jgi:hypothetical protein
VASDACHTYLQSMIRTLTMQRGDVVEVHAAKKVDTNARWELFCGGDVDSRMMPASEQEITCGRCRSMLGLPDLAEPAAKRPVGFKVE